MSAQGVRQDREGKRRERQTEIADRRRIKAQIRAQAAADFRRLIGSGR